MSLFEELIEDRQKDEKIVKSFKTKDSLSPDIFKRDGESFVMLDDVRKKLLQVSDDFLETLGVEFFIHDIILTGSLANYNWSEYSDVDLHILLDMDEFGEENKNEILLRKIFKEFFDAKKDYWNHKHKIRVKNFDVEIYVQDLEEAHVSSGVYSIVQNKWLIEPDKKNPKIDDSKIIAKGEKVEEKIDTLLKNAKDNDIIDQIDCLRDKIKKFRQCGLEKGGEHSYENLVFKLLRRNGSIDKLLNFKREIQNKKLSLNESPDAIWDEDSNAKYSDADALPFGIFDNQMMLAFNANYIPKDTLEKMNKYFMSRNKKLLGSHTRYLFDDFRYSTHAEIPPFQRALFIMGIEKRTANFEEYKKEKDFWRTMFKYGGRLWIDQEVISFWEYPEDKKTLLKVLSMINEKLKLIYHLTLDFNQFQIEIKMKQNEQSFHKLIPITEYLGQYIDADKKEMESPHTLPPEEKAKHPQMVAAKQSNIEFLSKKEKGWDSMSKRNFILNKNIAENKK